MEVRARTTDRLLDELDLNEEERRAVDARMLELLAVAEEKWPDDPAFPDLRSTLAARQGISAHSAGERIRIACALRELPVLRAAHAAGRISWDQLRWLTRFVTPETDRRWSAQGPDMAPWRLRLEAERQVRLRRLQAESDHAARTCAMGWDEERRNFEIYANYAGQQGAAVEAAIKEAAQNIHLDEEADDPAGARRADALESLVTSSGRRPSSPTLVVHADAEVLAGVSDGRRHVCETASGIQLTGDAVRRLACEAKVLWALEKDGDPVGLVSKGRSVTDHQMELLLHRDRGCTFPGCGSTWFLHAHHIRHVAHGGRTTLGNLTLLCGSHHRRVHDGRWTIRGSPPSELEFVTPGGHKMKRAGPVLARAG